MKKFVIILGFFLSTLGAKSQTLLKLNKASVAIPKGSFKVDNISKKSLMSKKFVDDPVIANTSSDNEYEVNGMLLDIRYFPKENNSVTLSQIKLGQDNRTRRLPAKDNYYSSTITTVNGNSMLLSKNKGSDYNYYLFFIENKSQTSRCQGILKFLSSEEVKAAAAIKEITGSVKFSD